MKVVGAGLITADLIIACDSRWQPVSEPGYTSGGTVTNIVSHLSYWGWDCDLVGGVGSDSLGAVVLGELRRFGADVSGVVTRAGAKTRRMGHLIAVDGPRRGQHRFVERCPSCGREFPPFPLVSFQELGHRHSEFLQPTVLLVDRANPLTLEMAKAAKRVGGTVIFEPGYLSRSRDIVIELLSLADVVKFSEELIWEGNPFRESPYSRPPNAALVVETRSGTGVVARRRGAEIRMTTTPVLDVIDSAGAGDAFMAGLLTGLGAERLSHLADVPDRDLEIALEKGQALGALTCRFIGANTILHATPRDALAAAIEFTMRERRIPPDFGSADLGEATRQQAESLQAEARRQGHCSTCLLNVGNE